MFAQAVLVEGLACQWRPLSGRRAHASMALLAQLLLAAISVAAAQEDPEVTHNVFFDVKIGDEEPKACSAAWCPRLLPISCTSAQAAKAPPPQVWRPTYKGSKFHRGSPQCPAQKPFVHFLEILVFCVEQIVSHIKSRKWLSVLSNAYCCITTYV